MAVDYSFPQWLIQRHSPWEALVAGVSAGAQIAANRQRGRALGAQLQHQQFQDTVLQEKFNADAQDLATLQEWWPTFTNAEGESLKTLQVPPLKNSQMWNRVTMEVERKKQQAAASEFANKTATVDWATPEGQAVVWGEVANNPLVDIAKVETRMNHAVTAKQRQIDAANLADYRNRMADVAERKLEMFETPEGPVQGVAVMNPDGSVNNDFFATQSASGRGWTVHRGTREKPTLSPSAEAGIIKSQIADLEKSLDALPGAGTVGEKTRGTQKQREELEGQLKKLRDDRDALRRSPVSQAAPAAQGQDLMGILKEEVGKMPGGLPKPKSKAEVDALPSGTRFLDPDGTERVKP